MADLSHDTDDGFHEIQLSGKQLVFLFMATTAISVAIFLCGVLVGRSVRAEAVDASEPPLVASQAAAPTTIEPPAPIPAPAAEPPTPISEGELSYHDRLQSDRPPAETLEENSRREARPRARETGTPVRAPEPVAAAPPASRSGDWAVQVASLSNRRSATDLVRRLGAKGYPAFLVTPAPDAPIQLFKVQVGRYSDRREAEKISGRLRKEEQFEPIIVPTAR